ncbi:Uncharacterized protein MCB1EB_0437 [Mycoavidus cysteinexigens]|uniref:Uncharacterized protein n=1 Tax=Mycoavidus cysteinexigens TaxID=1553431 RepID=A0A2Z6ET91_9BURK|nr:DUF4145 domain-containing protein [Mycoavidus cysteinexigens]BBE08598.1 Uncharacterized protein MCB1EB_0437 [Mycoavidus cysteinexigens]GLR01538.1 hypothetical protein GCM10007934_13500 [Mycoavidus cysteinexigens]
MSNIIYDCPHCGTQKVYFKVFYSKQHLKKTDIYNALAECGSCYEPIALVINWVVPYPKKDLPHEYFDAICTANNFFGLKVFPAPPATNAPDHVPDDVKRCFEQAAKSRNAGLFDAAGMMYRKTLEIALKGFAPEIVAWRLDTRIDKLAKEGQITPALRDWAHEIRTLGNDVVHNAIEVTQAEANQLHMFCTMLLMYLFTVPEEIALNRKKSESN